MNNYYYVLDEWDDVKFVCKYQPVAMEVFESYKASNPLKLYKFYKDEGELYEKCRKEKRMTKLNLN